MQIRGTVLKDDVRSGVRGDGGQWTRRTLTILDDDEQETVPVTVPKDYRGQVPGRGEDAVLAVAVRAYTGRAGQAVIAIDLLGVVEVASAARSAA